MKRGGSRFMREQRARRKGERNYGYVRDPKMAARPRKLARQAVPHLIEAGKRKTTVLWPAMFKAWPNWKWGWQGTGDCVSWQTKHQLDVDFAVMAALGLIELPCGGVCSASVYALGRNEVYDTTRSRGAGMMGIGAADAMVQHGHLYEIQYPDHDLRRYSGERAINWGFYGLPDELEDAARRHLMKDRVCVTDAEAAGAMIEGGRTVGYCGYTTWPVGSKKTSGYPRRTDSGWHGMALTGVDFADNGVLRGFWCANTGHGDNAGAENPGPIAVPKVYAECGGWIPKAWVQDVLSDGDCFAYDGDGNWTLREIPNWGIPDFLG